MVTSVLPDPCDRVLRLIERTRWFFGLLLPNSTTRVYVTGIHLPITTEETVLASRLAPNFNLRCELKLYPYLVCAVIDHVALVRHSLYPLDVCL